MYIFPDLITFESFTHNTTVKKKIYTEILILFLILINLINLNKFNKKKKKKKKFFFKFIFSFLIRKKKKKKKVIIPFKDVTDITATGKKLHPLIKVSTKEKQVRISKNFFFFFF